MKEFFETALREFVSLISVGNFHTWPLLPGKYRAGPPPRLFVRTRFLKCQKVLNFFFVLTIPLSLIPSVLDK